MSIRRFATQAVSFLMAGAVTLVLLASVNLLATSDAPAGLIAKVSAATGQG